MSTNITPKQNRYIWLLAHDLNIEEEYLRLIVHSVSGTESISSLNRKQAKKVIQKLLHMLKKENSKNKNIKDIRSYQPSITQKQKINQLVSAILVFQKISANGVAQKMFKKDCDRLTRGQTQSVIEALKAILRRVQNNSLTLKEAAQNKKNQSAQTTFAKPKLVLIK